MIAPGMNQGQIALDSQIERGMIQWFFGIVLQEQVVCLDGTIGNEITIDLYPAAGTAGRKHTSFQPKNGTTSSVEMSSENASRNAVRFESSSSSDFA